jgi:hypothetical protein
MRTYLGLFLVSLVGLAACGARSTLAVSGAGGTPSGTGGAPPDAGQDARPEDAAPDVEDAAPDAPADVVVDAPPDVETDAPACGGFMEPCCGGPGPPQGHCVAPLGCCFPAVGVKHQPYCAPACPSAAIH